MKITALLWADLQRDFFGAPGTLAEDLAGLPVLTRTLQRVASVAGLDEIALACPPDQVEQVKALVGDVRVQMLSYEPTGGILPAVRTARAFGRYGWRGGLGGTTIFDELFDPTLVVGAIERTGCDAVFLVPAGAALLDVGWAEQMAAYCREHAAEYKFVFSQAPPGLAGGLFGSQMLADIARSHSYPGRLFACSSTRSQRDPISEPYNFTLPDWLIATGRRFIADTPRGLWLCRKVIERTSPDVDGQTACRTARALGPEPWPREITVELTTRRPIEDDLRPPGDRGDLDIATLTAALAPLADAGDVNIMFAGAGDTLLHPQWPQAVAAAKAVGRVGLATYAIDLDETTGRRLIDAGVDVVQVYVDAVSEQVYAADKRGGSVERVWANIEALIAQRVDSAAAGPFVVPTMLKTPASLVEQEEFFNRCLKLVGWGYIVEPSDAAGQWPDRAVVHMAPPYRSPCRRIDSRLTLLADGAVVACDQDIHAAYRLGDGDPQAVWTGEAMAGLRRLHSDQEWDEHPLCKGCKEFHRP